MIQLADLPCAEPWFVSEQVGDGVTRIDEPHVHPLLRCNVWHVVGRDRDLVVDTALGIAPLRTVVEEVTDRDLLAVATHAHSDHVGGLHEFDERAVHAAEADVVAVAGLASVEVAHFPDDAVLAPYREAGYEIGELFVDAVPSAPPEATVWEVAPAPATRLLGDGDVVDLGDRAFEVLHLPGHSPGSIGLWEASTGVLFSGEAIDDGPLLDELETSDLDDYVSSILRLRQLPVTVVHGGHEPSFGRARLIELCDAFLDRRGG